MDIGLSLNATAAGALGPVTPPAPQGVAPLPGILDAANVVILGASIMSASFGANGNAKTLLRDFAAAAGFTGTLRSYAVSGQVVAQTIIRHADAKAALSADEGNNLYIVHSGGNNVSVNRPYPGGAATFASDYDTLLANITATDKVIPLPLTKRLYGIGDAGYPTNPTDVEQGNAASEANGSRPYNDAIILPRIATAAPDWLTPGGAAHVDPYAYIEANPFVLSGDGVHGPSTDLARYILARVAARALGKVETASRAGAALRFDIRRGDPYLSTVGTTNVMLAYESGTQNSPVYYGAGQTDGGFDHFVRVQAGGFQNESTNTMGSGVFARLADTRFHDADLTGSGIYVTAVNPFTLTFDHLPPGDNVTVSCCGFRGGTADRQGEVTLTGGQTLLLDAASSAASNQVVFAPVTVPASGRLELTLTPAPGSQYGYLHGVILDFAT